MINELAQCMTMSDNLMFRDLSERSLCCNQRINGSDQMVVDGFRTSVGPCVLLVNPIDPDVKIYDC